MALFTTQPKTQKHAYQCIFGSHGTIHTFKNYFAIVFSAISFQFLANKQYPNTSSIWLYILIMWKRNFFFFKKKTPIASLLTVLFLMLWTLMGLGRDINHIHIEWETITYFRNSWLKKYVSCNSYTKFNLNSYIYIYIIVIVIVFKCTRAYGRGYILVNNKIITKVRLLDLLYMSMIFS